MIRIIATLVLMKRMQNDNERSTFYRNPVNTLVSPLGYKGFVEHPFNSQNLDWVIDQLLTLLTVFWFEGILYIKHRRPDKALRTK